MHVDHGMRRRCGIVPVNGRVLLVQLLLQLLGLVPPSANGTAGEEAYE